MYEYILHCSITESIQFIQYDVDAFLEIASLSLCECVYVYVYWCMWLVLSTIVC